MFVCLFACFLFFGGFFFPLFNTLYLCRGDGENWCSCGWMAAGTMLIQ